MEPRERSLLESFDTPGMTASDGRLALESLAPAAELRALADSLVSRGWLRRVSDPHTYMRTEEGRLAIAQPLDVTLYTRPGCHLCEEAKAQMAPLLGPLGARFREINIDADPVLRERYGLDVPVIFLGSRKVAKHRIDVAQFKRQLEQARRQTGIAS
jgi:glutaredoxin